MPGKLLIRNEDVSQAILAVPEGHGHLRLAVTTRGGDAIVVQEATVAAIVRAYTTIKTHPARRAVRMAAVRLAERKRGYAEHQLIEVDTPEEDIEAEITGILGE